MGKLALAIAACFTCCLCLTAFEQLPETTKSPANVEFKFNPLRTASAAAFSAGRPHTVVNISGLKGDRELLVAEGAFGDSGLIYKLDLEQRWRGLRAETDSGICSMVSVPRRNEVITSSWDFMIRFYDSDTLQPRGSIPVDRSATRLAVTPDQSTLTIINEGYADRDVSQGRTLWSVDIEPRSQKAILGTIPFRGFGIGVSPNGLDVAICGGLFEQASGGIVVRNEKTGAEKFSVRAPTSLWSLAYSQDGKSILATGSFGTIAIDAETGKEKATSKTRGRVLHVVPGTDTVLVGGIDPTLQLLSVPDLQSLKTIASPFGPVSAIASLGDGKTLVTGTPAGIQRWNQTDWTSESIVGGRVAVNSGISPAYLPKLNLIALADGSELRLCDADNGNLINARKFESAIRSVATNEKLNRVGVILGDRSVFSLDVLTGQVENVGLAPDAKSWNLSNDLAAIFFVASDGQLIRYQFADGTQRSAPIEMAGRVTSLSLTRYGEVCCGLSNGDAVVIDPKFDQVVQRMSGSNDDPVTCVDWSRSSSRLGVGYQSRRVTVFEADATGRMQPVLHQTLGLPPTSVALSEISDMIVFGQADGAVTILSATADSQPTTLLPRTAGAISTIVLLKNDAGIVTSNQRGALGRITFTNASMAPVHQYAAEGKQPIHSACLSQTLEECFIAVGATIECKSTKTWQTKQTMKGHRANIQRVRQSPDGRWLASTGDDSLLILRSKKDDRWEIDRSMFLPSRAHRLEWSPNGRWLLVGDVAKEISIIDVKSSETIHTFSVPFIPNTLSFSNDNRWFASAGVNTGNPADLCKLRLWDAQGWNQSIWKEPRTFDAHRSGVEAIAISDDGQRFYSIASDSELIEWSIESGRSRKIRNLPMSGTSLSLLPGDRFAIASWHFGNLGILDLSDGSVIIQMDGHSQDGENVLMRDVVVSKDGQWALSCATADLALGQGTVKLWRISNGTTTK